VSVNNFHEKGNPVYGYLVKDDPGIYLTNLPTEIEILSAAFK